MGLAKITDSGSGNAGLRQLVTEGRPTPPTKSPAAHRIHQCQLLSHHLGRERPKKLGFSSWKPSRVLVGPVQGWVGSGMGAGVEQDKEMFHPHA